MMDGNGNIKVPEELKAKYLFRLPQAYNFADYIWPGLLMSPQRILAIRDIEFQPSDIIIASYPKSGTTWVSELVSAIVHNGDTEAIKAKRQHERVPWLELNTDYAWVKLYDFWQSAQKALGYSPTVKEEDEKKSKPVARVWFTHLPLELLPKSALEGGCRIIYVSRNPKDNAVSFFHFHQMARFLGQQTTTWEEFFPLYASGDIYCGSWFEHVLSYWTFSRVNKHVLFLKYEDMKKDLSREVSNICDFIDFDLDNEARKRVIHHCTFDTMKNNRMANREGVWLFNQARSKFMRKGVVGDWKNYFTVGQSEIFDQLYSYKMKGSNLDYEFDPEEPFEGEKTKL
uniref:Sulfotransferase domain-containing protein n=1 Tax=Plectus sambesii TaxID=2011161 RepID=A0A914V7C3_9BILA